MMQTIWHDTNGRVQAVYDGDTNSAVWADRGYSKATVPDEVGRVSKDYTVTVSDGAVTSKTYDPIFTDADMAALRASKDDEIKQYALSLMQSRIPALDSFAMVAFLKTIWPTLTDPTSQPDLDYCRQVYEHAMTRLDQLSTADRETIEGYDPAEDTGWP